MKTKDGEDVIFRVADVIFRVTLDDLTTARLMEVADACHAPPASVIAAIVRDVLEDDALAHMETHEGVTLQ